MNALEALDVIKDIKKEMEENGEVAKLKAVEVAERELKDAWHIDVQHTPRENIKQNILNIIKENEIERYITIAYIETLFNEILTDLKYKPFEI